MRSFGAKLWVGTGGWFIKWSLTQVQVGCRDVSDYVKPGQYNFHFSERQRSTVATSQLFVAGAYLSRGS